MDLVYVGSSGSVAGAPHRFRIGLPGTELFGYPVVRSDVTAVFESLEGWWNPVGSTGSVEQRSYQDGAYEDVAYMQARTIVVKGSFFGDSPALIRDAFEQFWAGLDAKELFPLVVEELGLVRHAVVRLDGRPGLTWNGVTAARFDVQFVAPDYRKFGGNGSGPTRGRVTGLPSQTGGRQRPNMRPSMIDAVVVSGSVTLENEGSAPPSVSVRINGPVSRPSISTSAGDKQWFDLDLAPGEWLDIDFDKRTVLLNGQSSRRAFMRGNWLAFIDGQTDLKFDAADESPTATMTVLWSDAWK